MHYFISYPRSGRTWIETRMGLFFARCMGVKKPMDTMQNAIVHSHFGYDAFGGPHRPTNYTKYSNADTVSIVCRHPAGTLASYFHYIHERVSGVNPTFISDFNFPDNLGEFITSEFGVDRLCRFLNDFRQEVVCHTANVQFYWYEDLFDPQSCRELPAILGLNYEMTDEDVDFVARNSDIKRIKAGEIERDEVGGDMYRILSLYQSSEQTVRKGITGGYKQELTNSQCRNINKYVQKHSRLSPYNDRYRSIP